MNSWNVFSLMTMRKSTQCGQGSASAFAYHPSDSAEGWKRPASSTVVMDCLEVSLVILSSSDSFAPATFSHAYMLFFFRALFLELPPERTLVVSPPPLTGVGVV
eukprot:CAMPEP_0182481632 /NCGR_PEP_ID=MMETSP1319-20130603/37653_1 /TAXON_ID=172717 /ORGANISM="Bolidomonas pacifica, Strain RCC208" /LENGTH=103 /DNA_ID=CAMNT_0024683259 /DNA_START=48 /DNA_END=359 /DNA_ORIENTATION=+